MGKNARNSFRLPALVVALAAGAAMLVGPAAARAESANDAPPSWAQSCGYGRYYLGDHVAFARPISFTIAIDSDRGYVVDCDNGAEFYAEFRFESDGWYVYAVWGQIGGHS